MENSVLLIGSTGFLGSITGDYLRKNYEVIETSRKPCNHQISFDLNKLSFSKFRNYIPASVIFFAGITNIEECEKFPEKTAFINVHQTLKTIRYLVENGSYVIWISSSSIFGLNESDMFEYDEPRPLIQYALQKKMVENEILIDPFLSKSVAIIRLTKVLDSTNSLISNVKSQLILGKEVQLYRDLYLSPISAGYVSTGLEKILSNKLCGIFHLSNEVSISYSNLGKKIAEFMGKPPGLIKEVSILEGNSIILHRPINAKLGMKRSRDLLHISPESLNEFITSLRL